MAAIRIVEPGTTPWVGPPPRDVPGLREVDERGLVELADSDQGAAGRFFHPGSETDLQLYEVRETPNRETKPHAHESDEIIYILSGEMHLGARVLKPGSSIYIPGMTLYGFRAGPDGLHFLNFRPRRDISHIEKKDFLAARA